MRFPGFSAQLAPLLVYAAVAAPAAAQKYIVEELPPLAGDGTARAAEINEAGIAVGSSAATASLWPQPVVWSATGATALNPQSSAEAQGLSESGLLVAGSRFVSGMSKAELWTPAGAAGLPELPGHLRSFALDVNDAGLAVGLSETPTGANVAVVWIGGTIHQVGPADSDAVAVNELGDIAGNLASGGQKQGLRWHAGTLELLPGLSPGGDSSAAGLSRAGRIAGWSTSPASGKAHGVVWDLNLVPVDLGSHLGNATFAYDTNDAGVAVGAAFDDQGNPVAPLVWRGGGAEDLNSLLEPVSGAGWMLQEVQSVNDRGEIAGTGYKSGALDKRAFLLRPDCDGDGLSDVAEIAAGTAHDANQDGLDDACQHCQTDFGFGGPGSLALSICGDLLLGLDTAATLAIAGAPAGAPLLLGVGDASHPTALFGGTIVPVPPLFVLALQADAAGTLALTVKGSGTPQVVLYAQAVALSTPVAVSNALEVKLGL